MKKYYPFIAALLIVFVVACGQSRFGKLTTTENPDITLANSEIVENVTNGVINFATASGNVGDANLSGPRFMWPITNSTASAAFIIDTTSGSQFIPLQDCRLTKMTIFGDAMASGDTVIVTLYKRSATAGSPAIVAKDTLSGTEGKETITFATNFDISASEGWSIKKNTVASPGTATIVLEGIYYDVR